MPQNNSLSCNGVHHLNLSPILSWKRGIRQINRLNVRITSRRITAVLTAIFTRPSNDTAATATPMTALPRRPVHPALRIERRSCPSKARTVAVGFWELDHAECVSELVEGEGALVEIVELVGDE